MKALVAALAATLLLALSGCGVSKTSIQSAVDDCHLKTQGDSTPPALGSWANVLDRGKSLTIRLSDSGRMDFDKDSMNCVVKGIGLGDSLMQRVAMTKPTDPAGNYTWDSGRHSYQATWTVDSGAGLGINLLLTERS